MQRTHYLTLAFFCIAIWSIFIVIWLPGSLRLLATTTDWLRRTDDGPLQVPRERAYRYAFGIDTTTEDLYFTRAEIDHLRDVGRLRTQVSILLGLLAGISWAYIFGSLHHRVLFARALRRAARVLISISLVLLVALLFFAPFFLLFHQVLFPQGNWSFPVDSLLITAFPVLFWQLALVMIILTSVATAAILWYVAKLMENTA